MKFKIGDKVKFLDEVGEGVITKIQNNQQVIVKIEDGFEIPYSADKLVFKDPKIVERPPVSNEQTTLQSNIKNTPSETIFMYFEKGADENTCNLFIQNRLDFNVLITVLKQTKKTSSTISRGEINTNSLLYAGSFTHDELKAWRDVRVDVLFFKEGDFLYHQPISKLISFNYKNIFETEKLFWGIELLSKIELMEDISLQKLTQILSQKNDFYTTEKNRQTGDKNTVASLEWEVDLHIHELVDSYKHLSNAQILSIQMDHMQQKLNKAITNRVKKIIFIHGVGNGVLKSEIIKVLKTYDHIAYYDAKYNRYGFGATEVSIL